MHNTKYLRFDDHEIELLRNACVLSKTKLENSLQDMVDSKYADYMKKPAEVAIMEYEKLIEELK